MTPIHDIIGDVVKATAKALGRNISYLYGDWDYISNILTRWNGSPETAALKYPIICLYSPYQESRSVESAKERSTANLELLILCNTQKNYLNEERDAITFGEVLRPIYQEFIGQLMKDRRIVRNYSGMPTHTYTENYRYGRLGVLTSENRPFRDFIDAIEISNLSLTFIEERNCNGNILS
jgi:hypothetical protein